jgi:preprotein translocase subunit YajC
MQYCSIVPHEVVEKYGNGILGGIQQVQDRLVSVAWEEGTQVVLKKTIIT